MIAGRSLWQWIRRAFAMFKPSLPISWLLPLFIIGWFIYFWGDWKNWCVNIFNLGIYISMGLDYSNCLDRWEKEEQNEAQ